MRRTWQMFAGRGEHESEFRNPGSEWYVRAYGREPMPVLVTEDEDGPYYGWIGAEDDSPVMIQPHEGLFEMQFPYGPQAEADRGKGRIVRLRIEAAA